MKPVVIAIGGSELTTWTQMTLSRKKKDLTGQLEITAFAGSLPSMPVLREILAGSEITVYIAGQLAFTGTVDKRQGHGVKKGHTGSKGKEKQGTAKGDGGGKGGNVSLTVSATEYSVKISARGKTKRLIDSSHQHPTTNMLKPTTKEVVEKLVQPWKTQLDWKGEVIKLDKVRFRDGAKVMYELHRIATEYCYFMYETRDGKLRVTDGVGTEQSGGDPLILGENILTFQAEQSEDEGKSKVKVKGQRTPKDKWGEDAVLKTFKETQDSWIKDFVPLTVQHYGDGDEKSLERRARFEMNKRNSMCKKVTVEVFHVQTPSGQPWDIGDTHYVEIPPEGIYDVFEVTELTYTVDHEKTLKTSLVLCPPPSGGASGAAGGFGLGNISSTLGSARAGQAGFSMIAGQFPAPWSAPMLSELPVMTLMEAAAKAPPVDPLQEPPQSPPLTLPPWFGS